MVPQVNIDERFKYLGKEYSFDMRTDFMKEELKSDVSSYMEKLDSLPLEPVNKIDIFRKYIMSKLR